MITGKVCRGNSIVGECSEADPALKWGSTISDPLLVNDATLQERGRVEIDSEYTNRKDVSLTLYRNVFTQPGSSIAIVEGTVSNIGILQTININFVTGSTLTAGSIMKVERNV